MEVKLGGEQKASEVDQLMCALKTPFRGRQCSYSVDDKIRTKVQQLEP